MSTLFPPFDPDRDAPPRRRFRPVPVRVLIPNLITILAMCAGLTAIRMAYEGKTDYAVYLIVTAAVLDMLDGRIARMLQGTSRFGAELDSLADFLSFGAVPALVLYFWGLKDMGSLGWLAALVFATCAALRLARFNVAIDDPLKPDWMANFFTGMPTPAAAIVVMLPIYLESIGAPRAVLPSLLVVAYTLLIAFLMVSNIPVFSGKKLGNRIPRDWVLPVILLSVGFFGLLISYPWVMLALGTVGYLGSLPLGAMQARKLSSADKAAGAKVANEADSTH